MRNFKKDKLSKDRQKNGSNSLVIQEDWEWRVFRIHEELFIMGKMQKYVLKKC